jgi:hypothetical protein
LKIQQNKNPWDTVEILVIKSQYSTSILGQYIVISMLCDHIDANPNCGTAIMVLTGKPGDRGEESGENEDGLQDEGSVDKGERNDGGEET